MGRKRRVGIIVGIVLVVSFIGLTLSIVLNTKEVFFKYVQNNRAELESFAVELVSTSKEDTSTTYKRWDVFYWHNTNHVEFITHKKGLTSNSAILGFYYSPDNQPMAFQGYQVKFDNYEYGWKWTDPESDNWGYTERITQNWFWFEAQF